MRITSSDIEQMKDMTYEERVKLIEAKLEQKREMVQATISAAFSASIWGGQ